MTNPRAPRFEPRHFEPRRRLQLHDELAGRARDWLPDWRPRSGKPDFGMALLEIAARIEAEVTQRLDKVPDKSLRDFLYWLGLGGKPGLAARLPIVFSMTAKSDPILAPAPVQLQAAVGETPVTFETIHDVYILPGTLATLVGADPENDAFYLPPGSLFSLTAPPSVPNEWRVKSDAMAGATRLQLEPELGLESGLLLREPKSGQQYRVTAADAGIVSIEPALGTIEAKAGSIPPAGSGLAVGDRLTRVNVFGAFDPSERNRQEHAVYIGADSALNVETPAVIEIVGGASTLADSNWSFSGKPSTAEPSGWQRLSPHSKDGHLYLFKAAGSIEQKEVNGVKSRWLRATASPSGTGKAAQASGLKLKINCTNKDWPQQEWPPEVKPWFVKSPNTKIALEGIANTASLVLNEPFYPLGREPRLFDAFYLGCKEAFSKAMAHVILDFTIDDGFSAPLAAIRFGTEHLAVGIGLDGKLHRLRQYRLRQYEITDPGGNASPAIDFLASVQPLGADGRLISLTTGVRPGCAFWCGAGYVTLATGKEVWRWSQPAAQGAGSWASLNIPVDSAAPPPSEKAIAARWPVATVLVRTPTDALNVYAAADGHVFQRDAINDSSWRWVPVLDDEKLVDVTLIVPVVRADAAAGELFEADGFACISSDGDMFFRDATRPWTRIDLQTEKLDPFTYPLIVKNGGGRLLCFAWAKTQALIAFDIDQADRVIRQDAALVGHALAFARQESSGRIVAILAAKDSDGKARPASWDPFGEGALVLGNMPAGASAPVEAPLRLSNYQLFPCDKGEVTVATVEADLLHYVSQAAVTDAALFDDAQLWSRERDLLVDLTPAKTAKEIIAVTHVLDRGAGSWALELAHAREPVEGTLPGRIYRGLHSDLRLGHLIAPRRLELADDETDASPGDLLYVAWNNKTRIVAIQQIERPAASARPIAVLAQSLPRGAANLNYKRVEAAGDRVVVLRPSVDIHDSGLSEQVRASLVQGLLQFPALRPQQQSPLQIIDDHVLLAAPWERAPRPGSRFDFVAFAAFTAWNSVAPPRPGNPKLSWEYWDGKGWWQIPKLTDLTDNLSVSGEVTFCVPPNLQPTDVIGHTNHWIRARLVGGDYGQETVTVKTTGPDANGVTTQTINRNTDAIHPPYVVKLEVQYSLCCPVTPDYVLTKDSGGIRDQSDANRAAEAVVEHFVPLSQTLSRLAELQETAARDTSAKTSAPPNCVDCDTSSAWPSEGQGASAPPARASVSDGGRALYLGFDSELKGGPINILFLVQEGNHDGAFPLHVDVLIGGHFKLVAAAEDNTRGLNESGVISLNLAEAPQLTELFGAPRYWLRVRPNPLFDVAKWQPRIHGAYLNAAFAAAAETQSLEMLGSSDGSPNQRVTLARPPVLAKSLELRVLEHLDDDEIAKLSREDPLAVRDKLGAWNGPWVLWREIDSLSEGAADARVYTLDDGTGEISFGNGVKGRVPPIERDAIVAASYKRVGAAAANHVVAWSQINLVTPLQGVERAVVPDGAAGGADPQDAATAIRFAPANLNLRDRALTLDDFEPLALQFSPNIGQVRALSTRKGVRLIVVMRGRDPIPSKATLRELTRYLADRTLPMLSMPQALRVEAPELVPARLQLGLTIAAVEYSGAVAQVVVKSVKALLDPASGGHEGTGWRLGEVPSDTDIAASLVDTEHLESVDSVTLHKVNEDGELVALPASLGPAQLLHLAEDDVNIEFSLSESEEVA